MEFHSPNIFGAIALADNEGLANQLIASAGPGAQAFYISPAAVVAAGVSLTVSYVGSLLTVTVNGQTQSVTIPSSAVTVSDTNSIDLTLTGQQVSAALIVDPAASNLLSVSAAGVRAALATANSIAGAGTAASPLQLAGDVAAPGNNKVYGTDGAGARGWQSNLPRAHKQVFPSGTTFTVTHNLNNQYPNITVYRTDTTPAVAITPASIQATSANALTITLSAARPIAITVVG